jgi:alpha-beta hydrolase superfamily lysophospholipase
MSFASVMATSQALDNTTALGSVPVSFGPAERALFGFFHPAQGAAQGIGVVLCNPLGYEAMCTHRTYRHLAERLAARGIAALRFDYHGCGDSTGEPTEAGRVSAWLASIDSAVAELRELTGVGFIGLFGVRSGAVLAAAAARRNEVESLILWAPMASGREFVRELRAFRMLKGDAPGANVGGESAAGYAFDKETVSDFGALDPLRAEEGIARRVLVIPRDDLPGNESAVTTRLEKAGVQVTVAREPGYAGMVLHPEETVVPGATLDKMVEWLLWPSYSVARQRVAKSAPAVLEALSPARKATVRESAVRFGPARRLFGIVAESSATRSASADRPAILFLNVGANHRIGPNRMYVGLARDLAALGYTSLRFDLEGLGDSSAAPGARENRLYSKDSVVDVKAAMTMLAETRRIDRFVLVGVCSGAYLAFHTCVEDPRVIGQMLINPQTFDWKEGDSLELSTRKSMHSSRYYLQLLIDPKTWKRTLQGKVHVKAIARTLAERLAAQSTAVLRGLAAKAIRRAEPLSEIARAFRTVSERKVESLLVFSFMDGGLDMIEQHLGRGAAKMRKRPNFSLQIVPDADHTFTSVDAQRRVHDLIVQSVLARFP